MCDHYHKITVTLVNIFLNMHTIDISKDLCNATLPYECAPEEYDIMVILQVRMYTPLPRLLGS